MIAFQRKALRKLIKESRPCAAGCGNARYIRRRDTTSDAIALDVASWPAVTQKQQQAAMQALQGKHSHSKQQSKRYKANGPATATRSPVPPPQLPPRGAIDVQERVHWRYERGGRSAKRSRTLPIFASRIYPKLGLRGIGGAMFLSSQEGGTAGCMRWPARARPLASLRRLWRRTNSGSNRRRGSVSRTSLVGRNGRLMSPLSCQHSFDHHIGTGNRGAGGLCAVVHCHYAVNSTIVGDSRPASGCCYRRAISW